MLNRILAIVALSGMTLGVVGFAACTTESEATVAEIKLPTMQCTMCSNKISKALEGVDGVKMVEVDEKRKQAKVTYLPGKTNVAQLELAVSKAGYDANNTKADPKAQKDLAACCQVPAAQ